MLESTWVRGAHRRASGAEHTRPTPLSGGHRASLHDGRADTPVARHGARVAAVAAGRAGASEALAGHLADIDANTILAEAGAAIKAVGASAAACVRADRCSGIRAGRHPGVGRCRRSWRRDASGERPEPAHVRRVVLSLE